ncbi:hypothetical protein [Kribbella jiaozuonensis]|uniref:DUF3168 domain-containing protein n=1 Tax=Kribbella jiaozuonensis TaxID=2575441 RepID=A0A4U3M4G3_9ACTN|nr:hypothetical protein [Kribbella jiaozuonensis]TKK79200.1 hypothetical protein FDA38_12280 [Kribbella jiaozuonensis]TKK83270.1 hypothetical protein FDA38_11235 [Kribbella jiaozuonensis]
MSFLATRQALADAASTVPGVKGYTTKPNTVSPGDAWPLIGSIERGPAYAFQVTWRVLVILSGNEDTAIEQLDELTDPLFAAINPVAFVDRADLTKTDGDLFAISITCRSE